MSAEEWRNEWCPVCRGNARHERDAGGTWRCIYCGHAADAHAARRLEGAASNVRKTTGDFDFKG
jgi:ribosomal protein L37AE/L43A